MEGTPLRSASQAALCVQLPTCVLPPTTNHSLNSSGEGLPSPRGHGSGGVALAVCVQAAGAGKDTSFVTPAPRGPALGWAGSLLTLLLFWTSTWTPSPAGGLASACIGMASWGPGARAPSSRHRPHPQEP